MMIHIEIPNEYVVAQGNAFFLLNGTVMAAPQVGPEAVEWTEAVEVERQDLEDTTVVDAIFLALHTMACGACRAEPTIEGGFYPAGPYKVSVRK